MKKPGSILIEVIASLMILSLTTTFIISASIQNSDTLRERILLEEANRNVSNLMKEFKYNMSREEIEALIDNGEIGFNYESKKKKKLIDTNVEDLEKGNDIEVSKIEESDLGLKLKIHTNIKIENNEMNLDKEFIKSWWMDEI